MKKPPLVIKRPVPDRAASWGETNTILRTPRLWANLSQYTGHGEKFLLEGTYSYDDIGFFALTKEHDFSNFRRIGYAAHKFLIISGERS